MTTQTERNLAENILSEASDAVSDAMDALKKLRENDTFDKVFSQAYDALDDAKDHLEDAISSVVDGFGFEDDGEDS